VFFGYHWHIVKETMRATKYLYLAGLFSIIAIFLVVLYLQTSQSSGLGQAQVFADMPEVGQNSEQATIDSMVATALATNSPSTGITTTATPAQTTPDQSTPEILGAPVVYNYPDSFHIKGLIGHKQAYSLSCEAATAVDWARFFDVDIMEYDFQVSLPHSDNPDYGFVGDVNSPWGQIPPYGYGVHAGPVADLLVQYGLPAKSVKDYTIDDVRQTLSESKPIIAWVIGRMVWSTSVAYVDSEGRTSIVAPYEHAVILTGYDVTADTIRFMSNGKFYDVPTDTFLKSWGVLGNMAVIYDGEIPQ
jgi:uncharacterized protein YvpB